MRTLTQNASYRSTGNRLAGLLLCATALGSLTACGSAEGGPVAGVSPVLSPGSPSAVSVVERSGRDFSCLSLTVSGADRVFCRALGPAVDARLGLSGPAFSLFAESADLTGLEVWDDTICLTATVAQRPLSRAPGSALYCFGEATLGANYIGYALVFGGAQYSTAANGSPDLSYATEPFVGGDGAAWGPQSPAVMDTMLSEQGNWLVMLDSRAFVTEQTHSCTYDGTTLTCPGFSFVP